MGLASSKNEKSTQARFLYEPIQAYSPMTRYHMLHIAMSDGGFMEVTDVDYKCSKRYIEERGIDVK